MQNSNVNMAFLIFIYFYISITFVNQQPGMLQNKLSSVDGYVVLTPPGASQARISVARL